MILLLILFPPLGLAYLIYKLIKSGLLLRPVVQEVTLGPYLVIYKEVVGPYKDVFNHFKQVSDLLLSIGLVHKNDATTKVLPFGAYHDNPKDTPAKQCRSSIGFVQKYGKVLEDPAVLAGARTTLQTLSPVKAGELKVGFFPASKCIAVRWPWLGRLSILLAVFKVYPKLLKRFSELTAAGSIKIPLQSAIEVYFPAGFDGPVGTMWVAFPVEPREELLPFPLPTATVSLGGRMKEE